MPRTPAYASAVNLPEGARELIAVSGTKEEEMPVAPTYPGVYVEEIPSGVRTITGVSTSVTAFVGSAKQGPISSAVHLLSYSDFARRFGGLATDSELSYAVSQFFLNGGSDAWVVRLAKGAVAAGLK